MDYKQTSDRILWQYCQLDDKKALAELFDRYFPKVYTLTSYHVKDHMLAEELAMDLFFKLWQKRSAVTITTSLSAYLLRSAKNMVINHLRKNMPVYMPIDPALEHSLAASAHADDDILRSELERIYQNSLEDLSPQRRQVFVLSREENLTYAEIAERMNLSVNTVKNYMTAALSQMRSNVNHFTIIILPLIYLFYTAAC